MDLTICFHQKVTILKEEVDLYDETGAEVDVGIDLEDIEGEIDAYYAENDALEVDNDQTSSGEANKKRLIECSASIMLPFSEDVAFDAFSDLTRQP